VIVGAGIGGAALANALAGDGLDVLTLEQSETYEDRVRGEAMVPWVVAEARELGVEQVLLDAGARGFPRRGTTTTGPTSATEIPAGHARARPFPVRSTSGIPKHVPRSSTRRGPRVRRCSAARATST